MFDDRGRLLHVSALMRSTILGAHSFVYILFPKCYNSD